MPISRRRLFSCAAAACGIAVSPKLFAADEVAAPKDNPKRPRQSLSLVKRFVEAGHRNLDTVKEMLEKDPQLLNASWDWGKGDWETALEGASHMGRQDIVDYLIGRGARANSLSYAMLGKAEVVIAQIDANPATARLRGPHGIGLLFHAAIGGSIPLAEKIADHLGAEREGQCDAALHGAVRFGNAKMLEWLIGNGAQNLDTPNVFDRTPLDEAERRGIPEMVALLERNGATRSK
ncbi:ankyrin repeat domain-containing protein [Pelagicoccus mobilis]|uniref:Ankyrin repeat domain-containing protein n=1 Tax=Pelagicoccus mobilis TaxID=415221 RepID=A0A934VUG8_9BACT|nr:ankyrin repeat domain-containing protein [Pelagicoccus mobilis]MBK1880519.1 ankyrin repeat domain-containing protein [Pelagicoccus mobilis]